MCIRLTVVVLAAGLIPSFADAQLIQVERGYVRAPFVRVERGRGLRARVRAPFVDVGGRQRDVRQEPVSPQQPSYPSLDPPPVGPAVPSASADVAVMDWLALRRTIRTAEAELDIQLDQARAADDWRNALQVGTLSQLLSEDTNAPPALQTKDRLTTILGAYDRASLSPSSRSVAQLSGFRTTHAALRELLTSPRQRQRTLLISAAGELNASLNRRQNGATWVNYLRLPDSVYRAIDVANDQVAVRDESAEPSVDELQKVLSRFDFISRDPRYRSMASLPEFQSTYHHLADYIELLAEPEPTMADVYLPLESLRSQASKRN